MRLEPTGSNRDALYNALASRANGAVDGPALEAAKAFTQTEPSVRAAVLYAVLLMRSGQFPQAEEVLRAAQKAHGDHPAVLVNLAKLAHKRGDTAAALTLGRKSLDLAPNDEVALGWWASLMRLAGRESELPAQLVTLGGKPNAWRPLLVLGEYHLEKQSFDDAEKALDRALQLAQWSRLCVELVARDLRATDRHDALVRLLAPKWRLDQHGPYVALAIARAHLLTGDLPSADALLTQVRPLVSDDAAPFVAQLVALRTELLSGAPAFGSVPVIGPIWAEPLSALVPPLPHGSRERIIAFAQLADCTNDRAASLEGPTIEASPDLERACRSIPLALSEAFSLDTDGLGQALIATFGDRGLVTLRDHLTLETALPLASPKAPPRVLVTGFFSRSISSELQLDLLAFDLVTGQKPIAIRLTKGDPATLAVRAEQDLKVALERAGHLTLRPAALARPDATPASLDLLHEALVLVLTRKARLDPALSWGGAGAVQRCLALVNANRTADTPLLLALALCLSSQGDTHRDAVLAAIATKASDPTSKLQAWAKALDLQKVQP